MLNKDGIGHQLNHLSEIKTYISKVKICPKNRGITFVNVLQSELHVT